MVIIITENTQIPRPIKIRQGVKTREVFLSPIVYHYRQFVTRKTDQLMNIFHKKNVCTIKLFKAGIYDCLLNILPVIVIKGGGCPCITFAI